MISTFYTAENMQNKYIELVSFGDDIITVAEEIKVLSRTNTTTEFKNKLIELGFENLSYGIEDIVGKAIEYLIVFFKKVWAFIKNIYYNIFGFARRYQMLLNHYSKIISKIPEVMYGYIPMVEVVACPSLNDIKTSSVKVIEDFRHAVTVARNVEFNISSNEISINFREGMTSHDAFGYLSNNDWIKSKKDNIEIYASKGVSEEFIFEKNAFSEYMKSKEQNTNLNTLGYNELFDIKKHCTSIIEYCDTVIKYKSEMEFIMSRLSNFVNRASKINPTIDESIKRSLNDLNAIFSGKETFAGTVGNYKSIISSINVTILAAEDMIKYNTNIISTMIKNIKLFMKKNKEELAKEAKKNK